MPKNWERKSISFPIENEQYLKRSKYSDVRSPRAKSKISQGKIPTPEAASQQSCKEYVKFAGAVFVLRRPRQLNVAKYSRFPLSISNWTRSGNLSNWTFPVKSLKRSKYFRHSDSRLTRKNLLLL